MDALLSVNIFAQSPLAALLGVAVFGLLLALPLFGNPDPRPGADDTGRGACEATAARNLADVTLHGSERRRSLEPDRLLGRVPYVHASRRDLRFAGRQRDPTTPAEVTDQPSPASRRAAAFRMRNARRTRGALAREEPAVSPAARRPGLSVARGTAERSRRPGTSPRLRQCDRTLRDATNPNSGRDHEERFHG